MHDIVIGLLINKAMFALIVENVRNALQQLSLYLKRLEEVKKFKSTINANIAINKVEFGRNIHA